MASPLPPSSSPGPYRVEHVQTSEGPRWRLSGPGLEATKAYPWEEFREKLNEMAELMNFAWAQAMREGGGGATSRDGPH